MKVGITSRGRVSDEKPKQKRDRQATELRVFAATRRLLERDGVLAGLNLREVADEAGVNRGLIYQYFGSRRDLIRSALGARLEEHRARRRYFEGRPFAQRRRAVFESILELDDIVQFEALLALDGDDQLSTLVDFDLTRADLAVDVASGALDKGADGVALHVATSALISGYVIWRSAYARDIGCSPEELDRRVLDAFDQLLNGLGTK